jgi:membrane-associated PAP2 superfamily phosphatase
MPGPARWVGLGLGLAAGWIVGLYQMLKGVHYLSHTIVTMFLVWMIILILSRVFGLGLDG